MLNVDEALALLSKMQSAAPSATATKLADIAALLQSLSNDNAYLVGAYGEALILPVANDQQPPAPEPEYQPTYELTARDDADDLLAHLGDALRPRLNAVQTLVEPPNEGETTTLSTETKAILKQIREHNRAALTLLDGIEAVVDVRQGHVEVTPLIFSANMLMREAERQAQEQAASREQSLSVLHPDDELQAIGDYQSLLVILLDMIDNATRYTPRGGHIRLKAENVGTHILFSVEDNGIGLRPQDEPNIGQPFWRAMDQPLVRQHPGTGLSLYLAAQVLALQDGQLVFSGEPDMGSTFSFMLPAP
jgi:signal transduction histidine kinase